MFYRSIGDSEAITGFPIANFHEKEKKKLTKKGNQNFN